MLNKEIIALGFIKQILSALYQILLIGTFSGYAFNAEIICV